jgi:hypothetical protein
MTKDHLLDIHQVAVILPVNARQLYGWHERNYGPRARRLGKKLYYGRGDVIRFLEDASAD